MALLRSQGEFEAAGRTREELLVPKLKNLITGLFRQQDAPTIARRYNNSREENPSPSIHGARTREDGDDGPLISLPIGAPPRQPAPAHRPMGEAAAFNLPASRCG